VSKKEVKIDLDKILNTARGQFKKTEKGLGLQMMKGSEIYIPSKPEDYIHWPDSPFHLLTGVPGLPFGKIVQIAGRPDSGKSTHAMQFMKLAQDQGYTVILWDPEEKFSAARFDTHFGGSSKDLLLVPNKVILEGGDMCKALIQATLGEYKDHKILLVWDSVGGSISKGENDKSFRESNQMAEAAKDNGRVIRGLVSLAEQFRTDGDKKHRLAVLLINQTYSNIGAPGQKESGGQKVEFHSSLILQLTRKADLSRVRDGVKRRIGITTRARVKKNHLFDGEDTIAEMILDITAGGIATNAKDPAVKLDPNAVLNDVEELVENDESEE
jgi:RecA/RadA recombinase